LGDGICAKSFKKFSLKVGLSTTFPPIFIMVNFIVAFGFWLLAIGNKKPIAKCQKPLKINMGFLL
jgi:hypothetical protein